MTTPTPTVAVLPPLPASKATSNTPTIASIPPIQTSTQKKKTNFDSPKEELQHIWNELIQNNKETASNTSNNNKNNKCKREWPTYDTLLTHIAKADYDEILTCPYNTVPGKNKVLCPHGAISCAKIELFPIKKQSNVKPYTGCLTPGRTLENCLIRLSSAMKPPSEEMTNPFTKTVLHATGDRLRNAKLFPAAAIKVFRGPGSSNTNSSSDENDSSNNKNNTNSNNKSLMRHSGNLLFIGAKVGQSSQDFFAHCQCTQATEKMPRIVKPIANKFWQYSDNPLALGISDFCAYDGEGNAPPNALTEAEEAAYNNFPFCVVLYPTYKSSHRDNDDDEGNGDEDEKKGKKSTSSGDESFDIFLDEVLHIPIGSHIYDLYACPSPKAAADPKQLQRIGKVLTTSEMILSSPNDGIFFKHQRKEEDIALRPNWKNDIKNTKITVGKDKGNVGKLVGWKLFEQYIKQGDYIDFETLSS